MNKNILWLDQVTLKNLSEVGGKNASLGEMMTHLSALGILIPRGFATTARSYRQFLGAAGLDKRIYKCLRTLNVDNVEALAKTGGEIRQWILETPHQPELEADIREAYAKLQHGVNGTVAIRSSATAEDLPNASFAGQQETFLNVKGIDAVLKAIKEVFASLFNDRAIAYRVHQGFSHEQVALSAGIQQMVRSDKAASGVMFTLDTESGFDQVVFITSAYGLGETVVQGAVNPDEFYVYKPNLQSGHNAILRKNVGAKAIKMVYDEGKGDPPVVTVPVEEAERMRFSLTDEEVLFLAKQAVQIEIHYGRPMDIEWAKDGIDGKLYLVQARPETVKSRESGQVMERHQMKKRGKILVTGRAIGQRIGQGEAKIIAHLSDMHRVQSGDVLVTDMTDPDWEPIMKRASAIVTNRGGRTCHAAIIARELGIPAVVGCGNATLAIKDDVEITVSCAEGDTGIIYEGACEYTKREISLDKMPPLSFNIMMNVGDPERAFDFRRLPHKGVGLARLEFIINRMIGVHPKALLEFDKLKEPLKSKIEKQIAAYASPVDFYIDRLAEGVATIAAAFLPEPVIVRLSDFKSNEYANLLGGEPYEPKEENPMLGFRGASRYIAESFQDCFQLECLALKKVREAYGLTNVEVMVPFVRTVSEAEQVVALLAKNGLKRGEQGLRLIMMCEIPSNALLAEEFLKYFDGFSIGSNDLTQLTLGLDRDSGIIAHYFDERDPAVKMLLHQAITTCRKLGKYIGICGQGPSDHPDFAKWLMEEGIESVSLNPDSVLETWLYLAEQQK